MVPITSLAQYTTAPTFRSGYIINSDSILQRPANTATPPQNTLPSGAVGGVGCGGVSNNNSKNIGIAEAYLSHQQYPQTLAMQTSSGGGGAVGGIMLQSTSSTLRRMKQSAAASPSSPPTVHLLPQHQQPPGSLGGPTSSSYDGMAPRTLSTGVAVNSQFYYGWQNMSEHKNQLQSTPATSITTPATTQFITSSISSSCDQNTTTSAST